MTDIKRDTITASTILTVLFMLRKKKAEAAKVGVETVPTAVALDGGEVIAPGRRGVSVSDEFDFSQQKSIFIRYPGYTVFFAPTKGTLQKEDDSITLKHY